MNQDEEYKLELFARSQASAELAELRAENERLRKALEEIANHSWYPELNYGVTIFDPHWYEGKYHDFKEIAREALEVK